MCKKSKIPHRFITGLAAWFRVTQARRTGRPSLLERGGEEGNYYFGIMIETHSDKFFNYRLIANDG